MQLVIRHERNFITTTSTKTTRNTNQIGNFCEVYHGINVIIAFNKCQSPLLACKITNKYAKILNYKILCNTAHIC